MKVRWNSESGLFARAAGGFVSGILILGFISAGSHIIPFASADGASRIYHEETPHIALPASGDLPVFVMREDRSVVRSGLAEIQPGDRLRIDFFRGVARETPNATEALLFDPNLEVLWLTTTDESRSELQSLFGRLQGEAATAIDTVIKSDVFSNVYRPMLRSILTDAVSNAWEDKLTQDAFADLLQSSDTALRQVLRGEIEAILMSRVQEALWAMLGANWANAIGVPFGYELDYTPVMTAVTAVLQDPRIQQTVLAFGRERLTTEEARRLAERFAIGLGEALLRDTRVPKVVREITRDTRLGAMLSPFFESATTLVAAMPRHLGNLARESSLSPLAAHIFKAVALGRHQALVLFVTPQDRARMEQLNPDAMRFLSLVGRAT